MFYREMLDLTQVHEDGDWVVIGDASDRQPLTQLTMTSQPLRECARTDPHARHLSRTNIKLICANDLRLIRVS